MYHGHRLSAILMIKKWLGNSTKKSEKTNQTESRVEKIIKKKDDRPYIKWKSYHNSFNSWINMKDILKILMAM